MNAGELATLLAKLPPHVPVYIQGCADCGRGPHAASETQRQYPSAVVRARCAGGQIVDGCVIICTKEGV